MTVRIIIKHLSGSESGRRDVFPAKRIVVGRDEDCDVRFHLQKDLEVSGKHFEIFPVESRKKLRGLELVDLGSTNGTWVNGEEIERRRLRSGDVEEAMSRYHSRWNQGSQASPHDRQGEDPS